MKYTIEYLKEYYKQQKCELLENEYFSIFEKMEFICECGKKHINTWQSFQRGHNRCKDCGVKKRKITNLEKYGFENPVQNEKTKKK